MGEQSVGGSVVVNCFKISIFVLSDTTYPPLCVSIDGLWIALKLVSLYYQTQHTTLGGIG